MTNDVFSQNSEPEVCPASITINGRVYTCHQMGAFHEGPHETRIQIDSANMSGFAWDIYDDGLELNIWGGQVVMAKLYEGGRNS